jgi:N-acetylmuramic acid 6-phosphate etherase
MLTEARNPRSMDIDRRSALEIVQIMNEEDARVPLAVREALPSIAEAVEAIAARMARGGRLIYVGAGTSGRLGVLDAAECVPTFSTPPELVRGLIAGGETALTRAVEGVEDDADAGRRDLEGLDLNEVDCVVGIAASGRTPYVLGALAYAQEIGALTVGVACNVPAPILEATRIAIGVPVGPEVLTGSTRLKAGTAQKLVLNMLSTAVMIRLGKVYGNLMVDVQVTNHKLAGRAQRIVAEATGVDPERAAELLAAAGNRVKVAIAMGLLGISAEEAADRLDANAGRLRDVLPD